MVVEDLTHKGWVSQKYEQYYDQLYWVTSRELIKHRLIKTSAEDVVQETFIKFYEKADELQNHPNLIGWLCNTMKYIVMELVRKQKGGEVSFDELLENGSSDFMMEEQQQAVREKENAEMNRERIEQAADFIGYANAYLLIRYYIYKVPIRVLAKENGKSENAMRVQIFRLRHNIVENGPKPWVSVIIFFFLR